MSNHNHEHSHTHDVSNVKGINLLITMLLNLAITVAEVIGGIYSRKFVFNVGCTS